MTDRDAMIEAVARALYDNWHMRPYTENSFDQTPYSIRKRFLKRATIALKAAEPFILAREQAARIAAFNAGLEAAAKVAGEAGINREEVASNHHDFTARYHNECRAMEAREIATAIRNLKIGEE